MPGQSDGDGDSSENKCKICHLKVNRGGIKCNNDKCNISLHTKCFDLISKIIDIEKKNWRCRDCSDPPNCNSPLSENNDLIVYQKEIECLQREKELLNKLLLELEYTNKLLKCKVEDYESKTVSTVFTPSVVKSVNNTSYSNIVKRNVNNPAAVLLVKTNNSAISNKQVEKDVKSQINPRSFGANVTGTKLIKDGLLINCCDEESLSKLKEGLKNKIGSAYKVCEPKKLNPRLIVYSVDQNSDDESEFVNSIIFDNQLNASAGDIKIVKRLKFKNVFNIILDVTPSLFNSIINKGSLYVGWKKCGVKEHFSLPMCYKCCNYGHFKKDCRSQCVVCPLCSGNHERKDCDSDVFSCINCKNLNVKFKMNVSVDHAATDPQCHSHSYKIEQLKTKINYEL